MGSETLAVKISRGAVGFPGKWYTWIMVTRRDFLAGAAGLCTGRWFSGPRQGPVPVIDGLGEIRPGYSTALLDQIIGSGLAGCVVTVGNPALGRFGLF